MVNKIYKNVNKIIRKNLLPDPYFGAKYACSPYASCLHACKYCDGRAEKYHVEGNFEKDITIRKNFVEIFSKDLANLREPGTISFGSGISDPYQVIEEDEEFFRDCIPLLYDTNLSLSFMTKSSLILRDIDILTPLAEKGKLQIMVSIAHIDDTIRELFEPNASPINERFEILQRFKEIGAYTGVLAMPFLPGISDSRESIEALLRASIKAGADFVMPGGLTLRPGRQKDMYLSVIEKHYPELSGLYTEMYSEERLSGGPSNIYQKSLSEKYWTLIEKYGINSQVEHRFYRSNYALYDEIFILLNHMKNIYINSDRINILKSAYKKYCHWLQTEKKKFNRQRSLKYTQLEDMTKYALFEKKIIFNNDRLINFLLEATSKDHFFDYRSRLLTS